MATIKDPIPESQWNGVTKDDRTERGLPLPDPGNSGILDAIRIRAALILIDQSLGANADEIRTAVAEAIAPIFAGAPNNLNSFSEIAAAIDSNPSFAADIRQALSLLDQDLDSTQLALSRLTDRVGILEDQGYAFTNRLHFGGV